MTREFEIRYGGLTIGGSSSSCLLHGYQEVREDFTSLSYVVEFLVVGSTAGDFADNVRDVERDLRS